MKKCQIVFCTVPDEEAGKKIAEEVVQKKLAACVNIVPGIHSLYRWKGELCRDNEFLLIIKSRKKLFTRLKKRIISLHPYEVPEIIALNISSGFDQYLKWIFESTKN